MKSKDYIVHVCTRQKGIQEDKYSITFMELSILLQIRVLFADLDVSIEWS